GPTVVACHWDHAPSAQYIAKIYDGVDYPFMSEHESILDEMDCMSRADLEYAIEANAYMLIDKRVALGDPVVAPEYHGSWTFAVPTHRPEHPRWVRLILLERLDGDVMRDMISQGKLPDEEQRMAVLQKLVDIGAQLWWNCLLGLPGLKPGNVMICKDGSVKLIDFASATLYEYINFVAHPKHMANAKSSDKPTSPIQRCWPFPPIDSKEFAEDGPWRHWRPEVWITDKDLVAHWLIQTWAGSDQYELPDMAWPFKNGFPDELRPATRRLLEQMIRRKFILATGTPQETTCL
ncbi:hypothetical protein QBC40DRAFT_183717, partial [Triangularia verruculosa]